MGFSVQPLISRTRLLTHRLQAMSAMVITLSIVAMGVTGCASSSQMEGDVITVTGDITVRGNVPFNEVILITDDNNWYILDLTDDQRDTLLTPARAEVTGAIRLGEWNGRAFTRMTVREIILAQ